MRPLLHAILRQDFHAFLMKCFETLHPGQPPLGRAWYLEALCHHLVEASRGSIRRLVITVPPRHLKSISASVALPAWLLGHDPALKIMVANYSADLSRQLAEQCRTILESSWYRTIFPKVKISERANRQLEMVTTANGARKAVSVGGSVTGFGADLIIIDDCMKAEDAASQAARDELIRFFEGTLLTRLNDKATGRIMSIQQRLHEADLPAYLLEKGYHHLDLPAIAERAETIPIGANKMHQRLPGDVLNPTRESRETLEQIRRDLGPMVFAAQYQQSPTVPEGNLIRLDWFGRHEGPWERTDFETVIQSWDTAATSAPTSDWSVGMTWGYRRGGWYLVDLFRGRLDYPELKRMVKHLRHVWKPDHILIESASTGLPLVQELRNERFYEVIRSTSSEDKVARLIAQTAELQAGKFLLPEEAPWLDALTSELRAFPLGRHDDQVDALAQFVGYQKLRFQPMSADRRRDVIRERGGRMPGQAL